MDVRDDIKKEGLDCTLPHIVHTEMLDGTTEALRLPIRQSEVDRTSLRR